jgi:hypothetical protein
VDLRNPFAEARHLESCFASGRLKVYTLVEDLLGVRDRFGMDRLGLLDLGMDSSVPLWLGGLRMSLRLCRGDFTSDRHLEQYETVQLTSKSLLLVCGCS